jgi:hypothetical protein
VRRASVKAALAANVLGASPSFVRVARGRYVLAGRPARLLAGSTTREAAPQRSDSRPTGGAASSQASGDVRRLHVDHRNGTYSRRTDQAGTTRMGAPVGGPESRRGCRQVAGIRGALALLGGRRGPPDHRSASHGGQSLQAPVAIFYLPEPPLDFQPLRDYRRVPEAQLGQLSPELLAVIRRAHAVREAALELRELADEPVRPAPKARRGDHRSRAVWRRCARSAWRDSRSAGGLARSRARPQRMARCGSKSRPPC